MPLGTDKAEALRRASLLVRNDSTKPARKSPITVAGMVQRWLAEFNLEPWKGRDFIEWAGAMPIHELSSLDGLSRHLLARMSPGSVRQYIRAARECCRWGADQGWPVSVPPFPDHIPKPPNQPRDIDPQKLVEALDKLQGCRRIIRFIIATGCRPSEACRLDWDNIDMRHATATLPTHKTHHKGKVRTIYLTPAAMDVLAECKTKDGMVFPNRDGNRYTPKHLWQSLHRVGIPGAYCLRHTAAQHWLESGLDYGVVAGLLGHSNLQTVQVYAQVRASRLMSAARSISSPIETDKRAGH